MIGPKKVEFHSYDYCSSEKFKLHTKEYKN